MPSRPTKPLVELETDKVTVEVPAPAAGVLSEIIAKEGETVGVGALLGAIERGLPAVRRSKPPRRRRPPPRPPHPLRKRRATRAAGDAADRPRTMPPAPAAAKLMAETGISADQVTGSGKRGQVLKGDVLAAMRQGRSACRCAASRADARCAARRSIAPTTRRAKSACG